MTISPDSVVFWQHGFFVLNATILFTWVVMALMVLSAWLVTRNLTSDRRLSRWQNLLEIIVQWVRDQIREVSRQEPDQYLPFIGTLFLFIAVSNLLMIFPGYDPPTGSLSTTAGLAICVFVAVPIFGILRAGPGGYLKHYLNPNPLMLPFNILGELSRTLALAVRLFGNVMSGTVIAAVLLSVIPLLFPVVMQLLGLLTGIIQAYIFAILATVYIASGTRAQEEVRVKDEEH
jgi:F-type H+-transporting ATPase subunit a